MKGYRTIAFNGVMGVVALTAAINPDMAAQAPTEAEVGQAVDKVFAGIAAVTMVGNFIQRAVTNSPIFKKEAKT